MGSLSIDVHRSSWKSVTKKISTIIILFYIKLMRLTMQKLKWIFRLGFFPLHTILLQRYRVGSLE